MKWLFGIWRMRRVPTLSELPGLYLRALIFGILTGPVFAIVTGGIAGARLPALISLPGLGVACFVGSVFSVSFFTACGIGNAVLRDIVRGQPRAITGTAFIGFNMLAAPLAFATAAASVSRILGVEFPWFWRTVAIEAFLGALLAVIIGSFVKLKEQVEATQQELREKEIATSRAQSMALQAQINPHFFFNTLNSISVLVDSDPKAAQRMIGLLAGMFRYTFGSSALQSVPLEEELRFVRDYLAIEQARFSSRLRLDLPDKTPEGIRVPGLVLQPLVENAIRHGISHLLDGGTVGVYLEEEGPAFRVAVRNTADSASMPDSASIFKSGHALENVRNRLRLFSGQAEPVRVVTGPDWVEFSFLTRVTE